MVRVKVAAAGGGQKKGPPSLEPGKRAKQAESVRQAIRSLGSRSRSKSSDQRLSETTGEGFQERPKLLVAAWHLPVP